MSVPSIENVEDTIDSVRARIDRAAEESIREMFARFPFGQQVELFTGKPATFKVFYEPKMKDGIWSFGVDLKFNDGSGHIEYTIQQTGWGGKP